MIMNDWIEQNYNKIKRMCDKFNIGIDTDDLCQSCIEQFLKNKKVKELPQDKWFYFLTRIVMNNAQSNTSKFYTEYRKYKFNEIKNIELVDIEYDEGITYDWVLEQIKDIKKDEWYYGRLFELYLQVGCSISKLAEMTTIPLNSVSRDINKVRKILREKRKQHLL
jgi:DNA-directed RNA polymerase specialized sigma24 family protein